MEKVNEYIQNGTNPKDIGFFSFTNHSVNVAKNRIKEKFPHLDLRKSFKGFRTLHSLAYSTLKSNVDIITPIQANNFDKDFRIEVVMREEDDENSIVYRAKHPIIDAENIAVNKMITFEDYLKKQDEVNNCWNNKKAWNKMALLNTARSGYFSSDRSIREYCESIWKVSPMPVEITCDVEEATT